MNIGKSFRTTTKTFIRFGSESVYTTPERDVRTHLEVHLPGGGIDIIVTLG